MTTKVLTATVEVTDPGPATAHLTATVTVTLPRLWRRRGTTLVPVRLARREGTTIVLL